MARDKAPAGFRWVSCSQDSDWSTSRRAHLTHNKPDGWVTTVCGATGTPGALTGRGLGSKEPCQACLADVDRYQKARAEWG